MNKKILVLIGVSLLSFTGFLDATIVSTALPAIQTSLNMSVTELQWIMNAFFLGISAFMASMGKIADIYGRRKVFYIGTIVFGLASIGAGMSPSAYWLIAFRAIQGVMTAITIPVGIALIQSVFEKHELAKAMGMFGTITGAGLALGPVVGGGLVSMFGWPSVFYVNVPFVLVGFILCFLSVKESRSEVKMSLDYLGVLFLAITIGALVFGVVEANTYGWSSPVIITSFIVFAVALILLIITEAKVAHPVMAGDLFKNRVFMPAMLFSFAGGGLMAVILFINPLYLNLIANKSIWMTGVILFIIPVTVVISSPILGHINHHTGCRTLLIYGGLFYIIVSVGHLFFGTSLNYYLLAPIFIIFGLGWAIVNQVPAVALGQSIHGDHLSVAMGALFTFFNIGAAVMLAVSVSLFHYQAYKNLLENLAQNNIQIPTNLQPLLGKFVSQPDTMNSVINQLGVNSYKMPDIFKTAFMSGMHIMFWPLIIFSIIALISVLFVMKKEAS